MIVEAGGLGSALRASVVSKELKNIYPEHKLQWLTNYRVQDLLLNVPSVDVILNYEAGITERILATRYELVINYESAPFFLALTSMLNARQKKGFLQNLMGNLDLASDEAREMLWLQTNDTFRLRNNKKPMQQILLEAAGLQWKEQKYDLARQSHDEVWATTEFEQILKRGGSIGLNLGSSQRMKAKRWPPDKFYELACLCSVYLPSHPIVVLWGPDDYDAYQQFLALDRSFQKAQIAYYSKLGTTIGQFVSLVNLMDVVVTADTFGLHASLGLGKKVVALWGPQPEQEVFGYGCAVNIGLEMECIPCLALTAEKCLLGAKLACMRQITAESVFSAVISQLS